MLEMPSEMKTGGMEKGLMKCNHVARQNADNISSTKTNTTIPV
jgi:hypothetical protein